MALTLYFRKELVHQRESKRILARVLKNYHDKLKTDEHRTLYALAETYAGETIVAKIRRQITNARKAVEKGGKSGDAAEARPAKSLTDMSKDELTAHFDKLKRTLRRKQSKMKQQQAMGNFDKAALEEVDRLREQQQAAREESDRRGM